LKPLEANAAPEGSQNYSYSGAGVTFYSSGDIYQNGAKMLGLIIPDLIPNEHLKK